MALEAVDARDGGCGHDEVDTGAAGAAVYEEDFDDGFDGIELAGSAAAAKSDAAPGGSGEDARTAVPTAAGSAGDSAFGAALNVGAPPNVEAAGAPKAANPPPPNKFGGFVFTKVGFSDAAVAAVVVVVAVVAAAGAAKLNSGLAVSVAPAAGAKLPNDGNGAASPLNKVGFASPLLPKLNAISSEEDAAQR